MEALTDIVRTGKVRYIGFGEFSPAQIQASLDLSRERGFEKQESIRASVVPLGGPGSKPSVAPDAACRRRRVA
jgi:hypothetical protein